MSKTPKLARGKKVNIYPSAIDHANGITLIGIGTTDDASGLEQGVYAYGAQDNKLQDVLVLLHTISTGTTQGANLKIGFVKTIGESIYFGWRDSSSYGVDRIQPGALAVASGVYESLIFDGEDVRHEKIAMRVTAECVALATNETLATKYQLDRSGSFTAGTAAVATETDAEQDIYARFKEAEFGFTLASVDGTFPKVTEISFHYNDNAEEKVR